MTSTGSGRRLCQFELLFAVLCAVILILTVAKWRGWIGGEPLFRPVRSVLLMSYFTVMAAGWVAVRRSHRLAWVLLAVGVVVFVLFVANMMAG
jgi:hypothetical protein